MPRTHLFPGPVRHLVGPQRHPEDVLVEATRVLQCGTQKDHKVSDGKMIGQTSHVSHTRAASRRPSHPRIGDWRNGPFRIHLFAARTCLFSSKVPQSSVGINLNWFRITTYTTAWDSQAISDPTALWSSQRFLTLNPGRRTGWTHSHFDDVVLGLLGRQVSLLRNDLLQLRGDVMRHLDVTAHVEMAAVGVDGLEDLVGVLHDEVLYVPLGGGR